ncbi:MAG: UDP-N-acetylmuramoyl-L-alanyl-D-glutamate--2,6-diaminopimelate ligase [Vicinamibacterales bacterium]
MTLREVYDVLHGLGSVPAVSAGPPAGLLGAAVTGITYDSRRAAPGCVFVALRGQHADGSRFAQQAVERGAIAVVSQDAPPPDSAVPWLTVADARVSLAHLAAAFYGHPSRQMQVVGITGTNGKTTTAYLLASIFDAAGLPSGLLGTVIYRVGDETRVATHTTPEAPDVQALLREMVERGCRTCVMEVSSHALALHRVDSIEFSAGIFTNLTRDHLDFHADMEEYFRAKRRLFEMLPREAPAVVNADDRRAASVTSAATATITYGIHREADVTPGPLSFSLAGLAFDARTPKGTIKVRSPLVGRPNVYNILAAVAAALALGVPTEAIERGIERLERVPGRFQVVSSPGDDVTVVVDYAHTDDALRNLLETARPLAAGQLITVFGCGGDRDRTKRPLMGAVAGRLSDVIIITSDNPRSEDPARIIEEIQRGITPDTRRDSTQRVHAIPDRRSAIAEAVERARPGDLVLIAGKGHEKYQIVGERTLPFDDVAVAEEALGNRRARQGVR